MCWSAKNYSSNTFLLFVSFFFLCQNLLRAVHQYPRAECVFDRPFIWIYTYTSEEENKKGEQNRWFFGMWVCWLWMARNYSDHQDKLQKIWHQLLRLAPRYIFIYRIAQRLQHMFFFVFSSPSNRHSSQLAKSTRLDLWEGGDIESSIHLRIFAKACEKYVNKRIKCIKLIEAHLFDKFVYIKLTGNDDCDDNAAVAVYRSVYIFLSFASWKEWKITYEWTNRNNITELSTNADNNKSYFFQMQIDTKKGNATKIVVEIIPSSLFMT